MIQMNKMWLVVGGLLALIATTWVYAEAWSTPMSNEAALLEIQKLLPAPQNPDRVTKADWGEFEARERVFLPDDFKAFIDVYGCGTVNKMLSVMAPMCLERKGSFKAPSTLRAELIYTVLLAPTQIIAQIPQENSMGEQTSKLPSFDDLVNTPVRRSDEARVLEQKFEKQYPVEAGRSDHDMLKAFQNFWAEHYRKSDSALAQEIERAQVSEIKLQTTDYTQHQSTIDYWEIFQEQLEDFVATSKDLDVNRFYLWGSLRGSNYGFGWLGKGDESGLHLLEDKIFLFDKDEFAVLEMSFLEFVLRVLRQDQTVLERLSFDRDLDEAFRSKRYEYVPNPNRR
jgi:hypothetical protein